MRDEGRAGGGERGKREQKGGRREEPGAGKGTTWEEGRNGGGARAGGEKRRSFEFDFARFGSNQTFFGNFALISLYFADKILRCNNYPIFVSLRAGPYRRLGRDEQFYK